MNNLLPRWPLVWITGAGSGIGRATALRLAAEGSDVIVSGRRAAALEALKDEAAGLQLAGRILPLVLDVTEAGAYERALENIEAEWKLPDLVILNAGDHQPMPLADLDTGVCRSLMEINFFAVMAGLEILLPKMRRRGRGHIACTASLAAYRGLPTAAAYGASKAAVLNACEALQVELQGSGVRLQVINPGFVKTPLTDRNTFTMPQLITSEEAAEALIQGLYSQRFEIRFPRGFAWALALLRRLPYRLYFRWVKKGTGF